LWLAYAPAVKWGVRAVIFALVMWGLVRAWTDAQQKFAALEFSPTELNPWWLAASCGWYVLATIPSAWFWRETLVAMQQRPRWWEVARAYYVGHLGKYVPGKALVVVLRAALVRSQRTAASVAALAVFVETLTLMAVGAVVAAVILAIQFRGQWLLTLLAVGLALCAGVPTAPPLFRRIVKLLGAKVATPTMHQAMQGLTGSLMLRGWLAQGASWCLMGASLWAALAAMQNVLPHLNLSLSQAALTYPTLVACIALATVAGFMSLIPGGLGVREFVVITLLAPQFGEVAAIVSAVVMRLVSILSEVSVSAILYTCLPPVRDPVPAAAPAPDSSSLSN
jgi:uncharacterized membrane protein YbhN (UPF0104 family)